MNPRLEAKALESLERSIAQLTQLEPYLKLAFARADQDPANHDKSNDIIGKVTRKLANKVIAIDIASASLITAGKELEKPEIEQKSRQASIPDCLKCGQLALPRPRRGLCLVCYDQFRHWKTKQHNTDIARFLTPDDSEDSGESSIMVVAV